MTLRQKQSLFARLLADLISWVYSNPGWELTLGEGKVYSPRKVWDGKRRVEREDGVHMRGSLHYLGLAADLNLFVDGRYISEGGHPAWRAIGEHWERLHPLCSWGGRFSDDNHVSLAHEGRK